MAVTMSQIHGPRGKKEAGERDRLVVRMKPLIFFTSLSALRGSEKLLGFGLGYCEFFRVVSLEACNLRGIGPIVALS